jgi:hypothetical protein
VGAQHSTAHRFDTFMHLPVMEATMVEICDGVMITVWKGGRGPLHGRGGGGATTVWKGGGGVAGQYAPTSLIKAMMVCIVYVCLELCCFVVLGLCRCARC